MPKPRIALYDCENAPSLGYFWGRLYETDIIKVEHPWYMLSYSFKWLGEKKVYTKALCDYPLYKSNLENDFYLIRDLHKLFDEADILIAHNGDRFDVRKVNARFLRYGMKPPSTYKTIDTLKVARSKFLLESNKLGALGEYLGLGGKMVHTGFDLWRRVMQGDARAWKIMKRYNARDVLLLEQVYLRLRPYMTNHPNLQLYDGRERHCPACNAYALKRRGFMITLARKYQRLQCGECGHWTKGALIRGATP
jgi:hypothetical protein